MKRLPRALVPLAVAVVALSACTLLTPPGGGDRESEPPPTPRALSREVRRAVTVAGLRERIEAFARIARENGGNRAAGTKGYDDSARYVYEQLEAAGYDVRYQPFPFRFYVANVERGRELRPSARDLAPNAIQYSPSTPRGGIRAEVAVVPLDSDESHGCEPSDFDGASFEGRIALVKRGDCRFAVKAQNAEAAGARAAIIYNNAPGNVRATLGGPQNASIPVVSVSREVGEAVAADAAREGDVLVSVEVRANERNSTSRNVIADMPGGSDRRVVMAGGHLDSVDAGPGLNDNASGSAALLETAVQLARMERPPRNVRFAFWGAEEAGLVGSRYYVRRLGSKESKRIALYLNFDMVGSPNFGRFVYEGGGEGTAERRAEAVERLFVRYFKARGLPAEVHDLGGASDHAPFEERGIAVGGLFTGASETKSTSEARVFGGKAGRPYDSCYHERCDAVANVDFRVLHQMADAAAHVIVTVAAKPSVLGR